MSQAARQNEPQIDRLEEAKNITLGWRIVGNVEPADLDEAKEMLRSSAEYAARVYELLYAEMAARA
ncbi:hypothetical protein CIG19_15775 [Enterobacterales bacterium CwR94]|nr:hypothetical protein CIG19_15775 [Enterobacterales bacterium CwR94]